MTSANEHRFDRSAAKVLRLPFARAERAWFYKWRDRQPTMTEVGAAKLDAACARPSPLTGCLHGSPPPCLDVRAEGWTVTENTVADSTSPTPTSQRVGAD